MLALFILGISYGFASGVSPGPTLGLVISRTLERGPRSGALIALAPLFTDLPIILLAFFALKNSPPATLGWLGLAGGAFVVWLGVKTLRSSARFPDPAENRTKEAPLSSLWRGITANASNPHPYLFWATVGAPLLVEGYREVGFSGAATFLVGFYALLIGSKLALALLAGKGSNWLGGRGYRRLLAASGVLLVGLGLLLTADGFLMLL